MSPGTYRHPQTLDIDMHVMSSYPTACGVKVKAVLFNRHNKDVYQIKEFLIRTDQIKKWERVCDKY